MRLLRRVPSGEFELTSHDDERPPAYAILSHTWTEGQEVTYKELMSGIGKNKTGYAKIRFCGEQAALDGIGYFWVDTCCIDKSSSIELSTAINSMFRWYQRAHKCYVYLSDVSVPDEVVDTQAFRIIWMDAFRSSSWFTRGWTLQELLAPASVEFYSVEGKWLGSRMSLEQEIHEITSIPIRALKGQSLTEFTVDQRKSWAANRTTTLREDKVYCLLGIFGVFLPLIYGEGEDYAAQRLGEEVQRRQKEQRTEASYNMSAASVLPFPRNERFVGRDDELQCIEECLFSSTTHQRMTLHGLGGCGKSALALEFAYRALARQTKRLVFWVPAISRESFELAYREIANLLRLPGIIKNNKDINKLVKDALSAESFYNWLMIVDNADDPAVLSGTVDGDPKSNRLGDYLPYSNSGTILYTTRNRKAAEMLTPGNVLELKYMSQAEARQLLTRRTTKPTLLHDNLAVNELLEILTYLPLAIVQAAAFLNNNDISVSKYISLFRHPSTEIELFSEQFEDPSRYRETDSTIAKTWHISFNQMRKQDQLAADYLSFIACIDRINIPRSILPNKGSLVQQTKALGTLTGYAFITERQQTVQGVDEEQYFDMHRLVHIASVSWLEGKGERATWADIAVGRLRELVPEGGYEKKEIWTPYLSHVMHVVELDDIGGEIARASLLDRLGACQTDLGQYLVAEATSRRASSLFEKVLGPEHPFTLESMRDSAILLDAQGKHDEAVLMNRQTLAQMHLVLGPKHPDTLGTMNNLTLALSRQGKYEESELINRETLIQLELALGPKHPGVLCSMSNLGVSLDKQGKHKEAESIYRQILAQNETVLGPEHPTTLSSAYQLANNLASQYCYSESLALYERVYNGYYTVIGNDHPSTQACYRDYAIVRKNAVMEQIGLGTSRNILGIRVCRCCGEALEAPRS